MVDKKSKPKKVEDPGKAFDELVKKLKKEKSVEELKALATKEKTLHDIADRLAAKKALEELEAK